MPILCAPASDHGRQPPETPIWNRSLVPRRPHLAPMCRPSDWQIHVRHSIIINATPESVFAALGRLDGVEDKWMSKLLWLRELPYRVTHLGARPSHHVFSLSSLVELSRSNRELILGAAGKFWLAKPKFLSLHDARAFMELDQAGFSKLVMSFVVEPMSQARVRLITSTRISSPDPSTRRKMALYWVLIRSGIEIMRRRLLRLIRDEAERGQNPPVSDRLGQLR